eukprot:TRINITY_DN13436_c0_g1_i1.p1 TRINITY_DN13436_c0_g1~~TRINITY_DN13436_c0_g1_i1.p1  ORF type:complete len:257 (-),score=35.00 TRINITY_DN13436_c0_g1_i1:48-818(-)
MEVEFSSNCVCRATCITIERQAGPEVTKNQYFDVVVTVKGCTCPQPTAPSASLFYEDGMQVSAGMGVQPLEGTSTNSKDGSFVLKVRINELSRAHQGKRFIVHLNHGGAFADTAPMKVLSKSCIVNAHAKGGVGTSKRKRAEAASAATDSHQSADVAELKRLCLQGQRQVTELGCNVSQQFTQLRADVSEVMNAVRSLTSYVHSLLPADVQQSAMQAQFAQSHAPQSKDYMVEDLLAMDGGNLASLAAFGFSNCIQ